MPYRFSQTAEELQKITDVGEDNIALEYDTSVSYAVGSYCTHEGGLYRCTSAATGTWDASKWTEITVMGEIAANAEDISTLNSNLTNINTTSSDTSGSVSLASADAWSVVKTINVPAGKYLFIASVVFPSNANGYRAVGISGVSNPSGLYTRDITSVPAANGFNTCITTMRVITLSAQSDIYIVARQNSGAAQAVYPSMIAVRLR